MVSRSRSKNPSWLSFEAALRPMMDLPIWGGVIVDESAILISSPDIFVQLDDPSLHIFLEDARYLSTSPSLVMTVQLLEPPDPDVSYSNSQAGEAPASCTRYTLYTRSEEDPDVPTPQASPSTELGARKNQLVVVGPRGWLFTKEPLEL